MVKWRHVLVVIMQTDLACLAVAFCPRAQCYFVQDVFPGSCSRHYVVFLPEFNDLLFDLLYLNLCVLLQPMCQRPGDAVCTCCPSWGEHIFY